MKDEKISIYRVLPIVSIIFTAIVSAGVLSVINKLEIDQIICILFVGKIIGTFYINLIRL